jgi:disulfide bond formation protein DsbB
MALMFRPKDPRFAAIVAILVIAAATFGGAFIFEVFGFAPCDLCLKERIPYYMGIVSAAVALVPALLGKRSRLRVALFVLALIFAASMIFGIYHAGVEWGFWPGPADCTGDFQKSTSTEDFLQRLKTIKVVRCDDAAIRILGLSLSGWNAVVSAALVAIAVLGIRARKHRK